MAVAAPPERADSIAERFVAPADDFSSREAVRQLHNPAGRAYLMTGRPTVPAVRGNGVQFELGGATCLRTGPDVALAANGLIVTAALAGRHLNRMAFANPGGPFAEPGKPDDLLRKDGLPGEAIMAAARGLPQH